MRRKVDLKLIIGFIISISLALLFYATGRSTIESLTVGLLGSIFTMLISIRLDMPQSEIKLLEAIGLSKELYEDDWLRNIVLKIVENYLIVKGRDLKPVYVEQLRAALQTCSTKMGELVDGKILVQDEDERTKLIIKLLQETKTSVKAVSYPSRWHGQLGVKFLEENKISIMRGVNIERILIIPEEEDRELLNIIKIHLERGVNLSIALEVSIPNELRRNFAIYDDTLVTLANFNRRGVNLGGVISTSEWDVQKARQYWDRLRLYSREIHSSEELSNIMHLLTAPTSLDSSKENA